MKFLDSTGISTLWSKIKSSFLSLSGGTMNNNAEVTIPGLTGSILIGNENTAEALAATNVEITPKKISFETASTLTYSGGESLLTSLSSQAIQTSVITAGYSITGYIVNANLLNITALTSDQLSAIASDVFDFESGSYHSAKLIGWDADNKVATITFNILCDNPMTPLKIKDNYSSNMVGAILPRNTSPYIGAITLAVPLDDSYEYDGSYNYTVASM